MPKNQDAQNNLINFILTIYFSSSFYINVKFNSKIYKDSNIKEIEKNKKEDGYDIYLLQENKTPEIIKNKEQKPLEEEKIEMEIKESETFDLNDISLIELKYPSISSINGIIKYYTDCNKILNNLYFYIIAASKSNNKEKQNTAGKYYQRLDSLKNELSKKLKDIKDYSFFSMKINEFLNGFEDLCNKLKNFGFIINKEKSPKINNNKENYIIMPDKKNIYKIKDIWNTENNQKKKLSI